MQLFFCIQFYVNVITLVRYFVICQTKLTHLNAGAQKNTVFGPVLIQNNMLTLKLLSTRKPIKFLPAA